MGLDIRFNRQAALNAGLVMEFQQNGDAEAVAEEKLKDYPDLGYIAWLEAEEEILQVPGTDIWVANDGIEDSITVRANKWGSKYYPLTAWLTANNIPWDEF
jgi:hypothetical protein